MTAASNNCGRQGFQSVFWSILIAPVEWQSLLRTQSCAVADAQKRCRVRRPFAGGREGKRRPPDGPKWRSAGGGHRHMAPRDTVCHIPEQKLAQGCADRNER